MIREQLTEEQIEALRWVSAPNERKDLVCPDCLSPLVLRVGRYGRFYGCASYPECRTGISAWEDGAPYGEAADRETRRSRHRLILVFKKVQSRHGVQGLAKVRPYRTDVALLGTVECEALIKEALIEYSWLQEDLDKIPRMDRRTRHQRLMDDNDPLELVLLA